MPPSPALRALCLSVACWVSFTDVAHAQPYVFVGGACDPVGTVYPCPCGGYPGTRCVDLESGSVCLPVGLICCGTQADCPLAGADQLDCLTTAAGRGLCLEDADYCEPEGMLTGGRAEACHTNPVSMRLASWSEGDCDGDGVTNGAEDISGVSHCRPPPPIGYLNNAGCQERPACEQVGVSCDDAPTGDGTGTCVALADGSSLRCAAPSLEPIYCATDDKVCPSGWVEVPDATTGEILCSDPECAGILTINLLDCVTDDAGQPVPYSEGNCDRGHDNLVNGMDSEPCGTPIDVVDSGPGGNVDAGADVDGGDVVSSFDAGPARDPDLQFSGGGGCVCRAAAGQSGGPGFCALLALGLALSLRGRRRARRSR